MVLWKVLDLTGDWMKLHNEKFHDLCCSPGIVRVTKWCGIREEKCRQGFGRKAYTKKTNWKNEMQMEE